MSVLDSKIELEAWCEDNKVIVHIPIRMGMRLADCDDDDDWDIMFTPILKKIREAIAKEYGE